MLDYFTFTCESKKVLHRYRVGILYIKRKSERGWASVGDCRLRKGRRRREGIRTVSSVGVCRNLVQIVCLQWTVTKLKALSLFREP